MPPCGQSGAVWRVWLLAAAVGAGVPQHAQRFKDGPRTWWPEPASGVLWAGIQSPGMLNQKEAVDYCAALNIGGLTGWRLPTIDEVGAAVVGRLMRNSAGETYEVPVLNGGVWTLDGRYFWTSTPAGDGKARRYVLGRGHSALVSGDVGRVDERENNSVVCVRTMEPALRQIARAAAVVAPVADVPTLEAYVPLHRAYVAYHAGNLAETVAAAQAAIAARPQFAEAYFALGLAEGRLAKWDDAEKDFLEALKIDKHEERAKQGLKWVARSREGVAAEKNPPPAWIEVSPLYP